jgi:hypothetical protein
MTNDFSSSLGVPIISDLMETIYAIRSKQKIIATYQICIETLFKFSNTKEATIILADGTPLSINEKNKISIYNILKKNKAAVIKIKSMSNTDIDNIKDYSIKDSIINTKSILDSRYMEEHKDQLQNDAINALAKTSNEKKNEIRTELDIIDKIINDNELGSIKKVIYNCNNEETIFDDDKKIKGFCTIMNHIVLPNNDISILDVEWKNLKDIYYAIVFDKYKLERNINGEYNIIDI